jgi:hypothetical protein
MIGPRCTTVLWPVPPPEALTLAARSMRPEGLPLQDLRERGRGVAGTCVTGRISILISERSTDRWARRAEV